MAAYTYLGKSFPVFHSKEKIVGESLYAGDFRLPNMLYGKILHSPYSHARILRIDTSQASKLAGVKAIVTSADTPGLRCGRFIQDRPLLALNEVKYKGEPVAAVAAVDEDTAAEALELIKVEYEELPAVFDPFLAMKPASALVHRDSESFEPRPPRRNGRGNIIDEFHLSEGDVERAFSECSMIHKDSYHTPAVHPGFLEPHAAVSTVDISGRAIMWCSTKAPFLIRAHTCKFLKLPLSKLRVIAPTVGGDFGGKGTATVEPISLLLAMKSHLPVKLVLDREEEFNCIPLREAATMEITLGANKDGAILAIKGQIVLDSGAYNDTIGRVEGSATNLLGVYRIPNVDLHAILVYTNNPPRGHVRAPRAPSPVFAIESHIDMLSRKLGQDPIEFRLKNIVEDGDSVPGSSNILHPVGLKPSLLAAKAYIKRESPGGGLPEKNTGWGIACGMWATRAVAEGPASSAWVKVNEDGSALLITGVTDNGGGQLGAYSQIVAEILSITYESISVVSADTGVTPYEQGTGGSQTTYRVGMSVKLAAEDARKQLLELASLQLEAPVEALDTREGKVFIKTKPERAISIAQLASSSLHSHKGPIIGVGREQREKLVSDMLAHKGDVDMGTYSTHVARVKVDPETGLVKVVKYFAAHESGFSINPENVKKQIEGGVVFGQGFAMSEEVIVKQGNTITESLMDYKLPTISMAPEVEVSMVEIPSIFGPYGAKGVGEPPVVPVAPAIANAVYDATGVRITELPVTPEKVFLALKDKK